MKEYEREGKWEGLQHMKNRLGAEGTVETGGTHWMDLKL